MNLSVHIERLVLDAELGGAQPQLLQAAVRAELARLLGEGGLAQQLAGGGAVPRIAGPVFQVSSGGAAEVGRQIAGAAYGGIGK